MSTKISDRIYDKYVGQNCLTGDIIDIAKKLVGAGLIDDEIAFRFRSIIYKIKFAPGNYTLKTNMTIKNMLDIFDNAAAVAVTSTQAETEEVQIETVVEEGTVNE